MVRWVRLFASQYLGFWALSLLLVLLQELPYFIMPFIPLAENPIMTMRESSLPLNFLEKVLGIGCILVMAFVVREDAPFFAVGEGIRRAAFIGVVLSLLLYYVGWILYFGGHQSLAVMMGFLVAMPPLYYACIGVWRRNGILAGMGVLFLIVHFTHVWLNLHLDA